MPHETGAVDHLSELSSTPLTSWSVILVVGSLLVQALHSLASILPSDFGTGILGHVLPSISITSQDRMFDTLRTYLTGCRSSFRFQTLTASSGFGVAGEETEENQYNRIVEVKYIYKNGILGLIHKGSFVLVILRDNDIKIPWLQVETIQLICFGFSRRPLKRILNIVQEIHIGDEKSSLSIHQLSISPNTDNLDWMKLRNKSHRRLSSIHIDAEKKKTAVKFLEDYLDPSRRKLYRDLGIPDHRGLLLHGPPGTGKTATAMALAYESKLNVYTVCLSHPKLHDALFIALLTEIPERTMLFIDNMSPTQLGWNSESGGTGQESKKGVTKEGFLTAIDGFASPQTFLVIATNKYDEFEEAVIRPGRIDKVMKLGYASKLEVRDMFIWHFDQVEKEKCFLPKLAEEFMEGFPDNCLSQAEIQGYLLKYMRNPEGALRNLQQWLQGMKKTIEERQQDGQALIK